jgi:SAM-dependent methyltransferase
MRAVASKYGIDFNKASYFELGCASGRVIRHFASQTSADVWCCDLNLRHTEWIRVYLPRSIKAFNNHALPHLPLPDGVFDFISAFSVFTHIDDFEFAWLNELRRILKVGGIAYITIQTENTWEKYKQGWIKDQLLPLSDQITEFEVSDQLFEGPLPKEKTCFWWPSQDVYNSTVFHSMEYVSREWGRFFDVLEYRSNDHVYQDVVILRRSR